MLRTSSRPQSGDGAHEPIESRPHQAIESLGLVDRTRLPDSESVVRPWYGSQIDRGWKLPRAAERVVLALDNERGDADGVELREAALLGVAGRVERKRECETARGAQLRPSACRDPGAGAAPTDDQRHPKPEIAYDMPKDPVENRGCGSDPTSREHPRLLDACHRDVVLWQPLSQGE